MTYLQGNCSYTRADSVRLLSLWWLSDLCAVTHVPISVHGGSNVGRDVALNDPAAGWTQCAT